MRIILSLVLACACFVSETAAEEVAALKAGASVVDITPKEFPVLVDGGFHPVVVSEILDPLYVRCLVLSDGRERIALIVGKTGIPKNVIMISATHCHSAPGTRPHSKSPQNDRRIKLLHEKIPEAVVEAQKNLAPAKVGWAVGNDPNNAYCRRFTMICFGLREIADVFDRIMQEARQVFSQFVDASNVDFRHDLSGLQILDRLHYKRKA